MPEPASSFRSFPPERSRGWRWVFAGGLALLLPKCVACLAGYGALLLGARATVELCATATGGFDHRAATVLLGAGWLAAVAWRCRRTLRGSGRRATGGPGLVR